VTVYNPGVPKFNPRPAPPTPEVFEQWCDLIASGVHPFDASRQIPGPIGRDENGEGGHETTSRLRRMAERGIEPDAGPEERARLDRFAAACESYDVILDDQVDAEYAGRALDAERGKQGSSNRMLHNLALTRSKRRGSRLEAFLPLLEARTRHIHEGSVGHFPMLDASKLTDEELELLAGLLQKGRTDAPPAQLALPAPPAAP
jgi:hypothetical protein